MIKYLLGPRDELIAAGRSVFECGDVEIGVFALDNDLVSWRNQCPHMRGPVCQGRIMPKVVEPVASDGTVEHLAFSEEDRHIVCPWHGHEFDLRTGRCIGRETGLRKVNLEIEGDDVYACI
ncbi:MAG: Rieske (2Fe-2S) protein [Pseudorhodoplanes sp.]